MTPQELNELLEQTRDQKFRKRTDGQLGQAQHLQGRQRPEHSALMKTNNPMANKQHPNRGKKMPQIGRPGVPKPQGFGDRISAQRQGKPIPQLQGRSRPDQSQIMRDPARNPGAQAMRETRICPYCGKTANLPNYGRWHGDNCKSK